MPLKPVKPDEQPKTTEAIEKGGHEPAHAPDAGKQPIREPYGKAPSSDEPPVNPARPDD